MKSLKIKVPDKGYKKIKMMPEKEKTSLIIKSFQKKYDEVLDGILQAEIKDEEFRKKYKKDYNSFVKEMTDTKKEHDDYIEWTFYQDILKRKND